MRYSKIFGLNIAVSNIESAVIAIEKHSSKWKGNYITFANTHCCVMAKENNQYTIAQRKARVIFPDGFPVALFQKMLGEKDARRVAGPDVMQQILKDSVLLNQSHYFYGSDEETLRKLQTVLVNKYPGISIMNMVSPPYTKEAPILTKEEIKQINELKPDYMWIGLGAPKQEIFMYQHINKLDTLMLGVGAAFDFCAQTKIRAPLWMQKSGLEWFYRLIQEPKRLMGRYLTTNFKFIVFCIMECIINGKRESK